MLSRKYFGFLGLPCPKLGAISLIYCLTVFETINSKSVTLVPSGGAEEEWFFDGSPLYSLICNRVTWISTSISTETSPLCTSVESLIVLFLTKCNLNVKCALPHMCLSARSPAGGSILEGCGVSEGWP